MLSMSHRNSQHVSFFAKQFIHSKNGTQKDTKTNHYILLTNVSIKRCIIPGSEPCSSGGGEEFQPDNYLTDKNLCYPSHEYNMIESIIN